MMHFLTRWQCLIQCLGLLTSLVDVTVTKCPWAERGLKLWSKASTWPGGKIPGLEAEVTITNRVLLDIQPPDLKTITVEAGGALVWGKKEGITLNVTYIVVYGEFHVGSEDCRFKRKATINLYGRSNSNYQVEWFGRKFIGVGSGGQLELHGLDKMSWTKLAHTIPRPVDLNCSLFYDHSTSVLGKDIRKGMQVLIWNKDGSVRDFSVFDEGNYDELPLFVSDLPEGLVVAAAVKKTLGTTSESLYTALESLGANDVRSVLNDQNYVFIARLGDKGSAQEKLLTEEPVRLLDHERDLAFMASSSFSLVNGAVDFKVMDLEVASPKITVQHDVSSWSAGDEILVTSTDFDWRQAEVKTIVVCDDCAYNQIRLDTPFKYMHYGEITMNVDERAEVALLSRNVKIQGQLEKECYFHNKQEKWLCKTFQRDLFGGHVKSVLGSTIHVEGVELFQLGQQQFKAAYPLHFHMMNDARGMWFRNNSIHHSLSRCITIHGTHNSEVSDNVCYLHLGHGYFLEDSVEQNNTLHRNLGVGTEHAALIMSDMRKEWCGKLELYCDDIGTFWLTHPNNIVTDNVAGGSDGSGFFVAFSEAPIGMSKNVSWILDVVPRHSVQYYPLTWFSGNVAHSNFKSGLFFDSVISAGQKNGGLFIPENGVIDISPLFDPRDPPNASGAPVWTTIDRLTCYKNMLQNVWMKGGNIYLSQSSLADSNRGFFGGTIGDNSGTMVKDSVFVGSTDNKGMPEIFVDRAVKGNPTKLFDHSNAKLPYESLTGVGFYQGPMFVENCHFSRYGHYWWADEWEKEYGFRPVRPGGALSFHRNNMYPTKPWSHTKNIKFGYCDNVNDGHWVFKGNLSTYGWSDDDGNKAHTFRDLDGSVTGQANTQVVIDRPFYTGDECSPRPDWHMTVCPYKYIQVEFLTSDGVMSRTNKVKSPLIIRRDDVPQDPLVLKGTQKNKFLMRTHRSYTVNFNSTLGDVPMEIDVRAANLEKGDVIRIGLCLPKDTTQFSVRSQYPIITPNEPHVMATSLKDLDEDVTGRMFFWDSRVGLLYFKMITNETRQNLRQECAGDKCVRYKIYRLDGGPGPTDCSRYKSPPVADNSTKPTVPQPRVCTTPESAEGLGAVPSDVLVASPFTVQTCAVPDPLPDRSASEYRGCFKDLSPVTDVPFFTVNSNFAMTRKWCQDRCFYRGYAYSALTLGSRCSCGDVFGLHGAVEDDKCNKACSGDDNVTCGAIGKIEVYTTGLALKPAPARCGPNDRGEIVEEGHCLYVQHQMLTVGDAQRLCARLGGNLAAIQSQEKQTAVEFYLRDKMTESQVWIGLNHVRDVKVWVQMDGTRLKDFDFWKKDGGTDPLKHFVYMSGLDGYKWMQTRDVIHAAPLCDLPLSPLRATEACGATGAGLRIGPSGTCYMVLHQLMPQLMADYACHLAGGILADYDDDESGQALTHALYRMGVDQDYWITQKNKVMKWSDSTYGKASVTKDDLAGVVCILDTSDSTTRCSTGWVQRGTSCYLNLGTVVKSYTEGAALCERDSGGSRLVRVDRRRENQFLTGLIAPGYTDTSHILLGLHYSPRNDAFIWGNGQLPDYDAWLPGHGIQNLAGGSCAVLDPEASGSWKNAPCLSMLANVVCEMPTLDLRSKKNT